MKKLFYVLKLRFTLKKYAFTGKFKSYKQAMENQRLSKKKYDIFLNNYFKNKADIFCDETKVKIYGRFRFFFANLKDVCKILLIIVAIRY